MRALAETIEMINSIHETDEVLRRVMDTVIQLSGAERGFIMLRDRDTDELEFKIARGADQAELAQSEFTVSHTILNDVMTSGKPLITDNATNDPRYQDKKSVMGFSLRSIMAVPLTVRDNIIGVVCCDNRIMVAVFKPNDLDQLADFAHQAAIAIENARLFEAARTQLAELRENSDLLSNILGSIVSGVITVDHGGLINTCNQAGAAIFGMQPEEVEEQPLSAMMPPELVSEVNPAMESVRKKGEQKTLQLTPVLGDRGQRQINIVLSPLRNSTGAIQGVAIVLDDLTDLLQREEQLSEARRYLPTALVNHLRSIDVTGVTGEERIITAISVDVRGFSTFSEYLEPEALMEIINKYLSLAADAISLFGGVVDKFLGDAVTGLYNTQLNPQEDHAVRTVRGAMALVRDLMALHEVMPPEQCLFYGIGIHTGKAVLGNVGSPERKEFAAIGEATDISKILEGNAKGGEIVISQATYDLVQENFECEAFVPEKTKGRSDITIAYRVLKQKKAIGQISLDDFEF